MAEAWCASIYQVQYAALNESLAKGVLSEESSEGEADLEPTTRAKTTPRMREEAIARSIMRGR